MTTKNLNINICYSFTALFKLYTHRYSTRHDNRRLCYIIIITTTTTTIIIPPSPPSSSFFSFAAVPTANQSFQNPHNAQYTICFNLYSTMMAFMSSRFITCRFNLIPLPKLLRGHPFSVTFLFEHLPFTNKFKLLCVVPSLLIFNILFCFV